MKAFDLSGRVALITGGGSGIGKGCAKMLADAGAQVFIVGRKMGKLVETRQEIAKSNGKCECYAADLSEESNCRSMIEECISRFGRLDILVNSAGSRGAHGKLEDEFSTENLNSVMSIDFNATFNCTKYAYPYLEKSGHGSIINISSLAGLYARGPIVYSAAKGAVKSFSRTMAKRLGGMGIRVNTIYPGFIITEMTEKVRYMPDMIEKFKNESPLGLIGEVEDVAYCALYLASDAAKFVTGQDFIIDGGVTC